MCSPGGPRLRGQGDSGRQHAEGTDFVYGRDGTIVRCAWHGWEFDIATGQALADPRFHARTYRVVVEDGFVVVLT